MREGRKQWISTGCYTVLSEFLAAGALRNGQCKLCNVSETLANSPTALLPPSESPFSAAKIDALHEAKLGLMEGYLQNALADINAHQRLPTARALVAVS